MGTLNLKIERVRRQLALLQQQQKLGQAYPDFLVAVQRKMMELENQLRQLVQTRQELNTYTAPDTKRGMTNGEQRSKPESIFAVN